MKSKTAGDFMIPLDKYPHIPYWFTMREAIAIIHHSTLEINGRQSLARALLVFNEEYKLLGMLRRRDVLKALDPEELFSKPAKYSKKLFSIDMDPELLEVSFERMIKALQDKAESPVSEIMVPVHYTVQHDDHLMKIIFEMDKSQSSLIPVMKDDVVIGVIRTVEIMNEIASILEIE